MASWGFGRGMLLLDSPCSECKSDLSVKQVAATAFCAVLELVTGDKLDHYF
jgi:hypothetical protein